MNRQLVGWSLIAVGSCGTVPLAILRIFPQTQLLTRTTLFAATLSCYLWIPVMMIFVGSCLVLRRVWRKVALGVTAALLAYLVLPLLIWTPAKHQPNDAVEYVSLNSQFGFANLDDLREQIPKSTSLLVIQEFTEGMQERIENSPIGAQFPYFVGAARQDASGTAIYSRLPITEVARVDGPFLNLVVKLTTADGGHLYVAAIHAASPTLGVRVWNDNAQQLARMLGPYATEHLMVVGDFNATNEHITMSYFRDIGLRDPMGERLFGASAWGQWQPTWPVGQLTPAFAQIDHLLVSTKLDCTLPRAFIARGTDHKGLTGAVWTKQP